MVRLRRYSLKMGVGLGTVKSCRSTKFSVVTRKTAFERL